MIDSQLRGLKDQLLIPIASLTSDTLHPTSISVIGGLIGLTSAASVVAGRFELGLALWLLNRLLDGLDGAVARHTGKQSDLGGFIDLMIDFIIYTIIPIAFVLQQPRLEVALAALLLMGSYYVNGGSWLMLSALLEKRRKLSARPGITSLIMPKGIIEGAETVFFYILFFLFPGQIALLFALFAALVLFTAIQRMIWAVRHL